ncbi:MAG: hypothetical protein H6625_02225 [Bdellovibrionaceae bacterium]|nr:hypothetical protein [Pseudobdellovibrionaceae bacterium]
MRAFRFAVILLLVSVLNLETLYAKKKVQYRKTQDVSFDEANIDGEVRSPDGSYLHQKRGVKFLPLYKVRKNFDVSIKDSVEYLR